MAGKKKAPPELYNVCSTITGAQVIIGVTLDLARSEAARLNAEARQTHPDTNEPWGLHEGVVTTYEVVSATGIVVA